MYDLKALPLWAQRYINVLERQVDYLNERVNKLTYHDPLEDIICGVDMKFSQMSSKSDE